MIEFFFEGEIMWRRRPSNSATLPWDRRGLTPWVIWKRAPTLDSEWSWRFRRNINRNKPAVGGGGRLTLLRSLINPENLDDSIAGARGQISAVESKGHAAHPSLGQLQLMNFRAREDIPTK